MFSFFNTSKMFTWTSTSSVTLIFFRSSKFAFCNLLKSVVFPAPLHPSIMHRPWRTVISPLLTKSLSFCRSICFVLTEKMHSHESPLFSCLTYDYIAIILKDKATQIVRVLQIQARADARYMHHGVFIRYGRCWKFKTHMQFQVCITVSINI